MIDDVQRLQYLREKAICIPSSSRSNPNRVQTTRANRAGCYVDEAADLYRDLERRDTELKAKKAEAEEWIRTLEGDRAKRVMRLLFVECHSVRYTANVENISMRRVNQIRLGALSKLETN